MKIKLLKDAMENLVNDLGYGLLASDIYTSDMGQSIIGYNSNAQACALFADVTERIQKSLGGAEFPLLNKYYVMDLEGGNLVFIINLQEFQWGMLLDSSKIKLGLLISIIMPELIKTFAKANEE